MRATLTTAGTTAHRQPRYLLLERPEALRPCLTAGLLSFRQACVLASRWLPQTAVKLSINMHQIVHNKYALKDAQMKAI
jgi:hypothetical protein